MMRWMWSEFTVSVELPAASWEGCLTSKAMGAASDGLFYGGGVTLLWAQIVMVVSVCAFTGIVTWILVMIVNGIWGFRVTPDEEQTGLDLSQHEEKAYSA